jgi:hypothetical protein
VASDERAKKVAQLRARAVSAGGDAVFGTRKATLALVKAVGELADSAIDRVLLTDERVTSADEARQLLATEADTEALADNIQRVVALAVPVFRMAARGAKFTKFPWAMAVSGSFSIGVAVRNGVRELQLLASLVAYRLEQGTGAPADPALVKKVAIDLYLKPRRAPELSDSKLRLVRLTRKWLLSGAIGRSTSKRADRAFDAAEQLDGKELAARWESVVRGASR